MPCAGHDRNCKSPFERFWIALREMVAHRRQRRSLGQIDPRFMRDVGLSEEDVDRETSKRFWE